MAGAGGTPPPPLRLKDLLELDCDSCSAAGFRCYPRRLGESVSSAPMRHLLDSSPSLRLRRRPSKLSHYLSRSLSRRLSLSRRGGGFWRRRDEEEEEDAAAAATGTGAPAGCRSGSSSSEELDTSSSSESSDNYSSGRTSRRRSRSESDSDSDFSSATEDSVHHPSQAAGARDEHEVAMKKGVSKEGSSSGSEADDKEQEQEQEQLSPVAVMDFPFNEDDDELGDAGVACSPPSFSLARLQRRKTHKIRRFEISRDDELAPLDLEARLATTSDPDDPAAAAADPPQQQMIQCRTEDAATAPPTCCAGSVVHDVPDEDGLISLLKGTVSAGMDDASSERLLLDLFLEMKRRRSYSEACAEARPLTGPAAAGGVPRRKAAERVVDGGEAVAAAARGWLEGTGTEKGWGLADVLSGGAAVVEEMERGRRWMQVGEEEREVGAVVAGMLVDQLLCEVVRCLLV